jgi:integrase
VVINKKLAAENSKERNASEEFFSYEEAQLFLSKIKDHELYELFYVTLFFGLRREEILGLRWSAIDFINKTMIINHTVTRGTTINRLNATKTESSTRKYPLTDEQIEMFKQLKARELANRELFGNAYHDNDYIFKHADGSLYYPDYPSKAFRKLIDNMPELPQDITFHGLRTSCVSILVHQGMDIKSIQKWVGHKDLDTTLRIYAQVKEKEAKREILDKMKEIIPLKKYKEE